MQCTVAQVYTDAQAHLADPGAVWATPTLLLPYFQRAYRKMYDAIAGFAGNRIEHTIYFNVAPNTTLWIPNANGVSDMAEPSELYERGNLHTGAISGTNTATPINVNAVAHGLPSNTDVVVGGVAGTMAPWGRWFNTFVDANNFTLNGSASDGSAGTGGVWSTSSDKFIPMEPVDTIPDRDLAEELIDYTWQNEALYFRGATTQRQVKLVYVASGSAPSLSSATIGIDNCLNFLGAATAYYAAKARGWQPLADELKTDCFGPSGEGDSSGGMIRDLTAVQVLEMQRKVRTALPFRGNRSSSAYPWLL